MVRRAFVFLIRKSASHEKFIGVTAVDPDPVLEAEIGFYYQGRPCKGRVARIHPPEWQAGSSVIPTVRIAVDWPSIRKRGGYVRRNARGEAAP